MNTKVAVLEKEDEKWKVDKNSKILLLEKGEATELTVLPEAWAE